MTHTRKERGVNRRATCFLFSVLPNFNHHFTFRKSQPRTGHTRAHSLTHRLTHSQVQGTPPVPGQHIYSHTWRVVHRVVLGCRHGRRPRRSRDSPTYSEWNRPTLGPIWQCWCSGNQGAETNRQTFTRKPAGSGRPIHPHATPQLVQSERLQVDWSRIDDASTSHTIHTISNGDIDVDD